MEIPFPEQHYSSRCALSITVVERTSRARAFDCALSLSLALSCTFSRGATSALCSLLPAAATLSLYSLSVRLLSASLSAFLSWPRPLVLASASASASLFSPQPQLHRSSASIISCSNNYSLQRKKLLYCIYYSYD